MNGVSRAARLMRMAELLKARRWRSRELAQELGVSQRTISRDLLDLQSEPLRLPLACESWEWFMWRPGVEARSTWH